ncbi:required for meiotic nuclear division protein 1 homolog [Leptopilina boulardi]|uniref:required for meiotic nuclear division protein 1 homolog n=1 Tax=Leptopilina boulardi TaxID=63433 RepID=UPI0021F5E224|nr:required for meiotic nuclear division protein 1 homolog [Leptopilina boulardi]XP_051160027.1 required for meiotic nuclear division protein 1 homolog [Leptopilina boulardi]
MIVITIQRSILQAIKPINLNSFYNVGITLLQTQRNFITVTSQFFTNSKLEKQSIFFNNAKYCTQKKDSHLKPVKEIISPLQIKKRPLKKKKSYNDEEDIPVPGFWKVKALATAEEYNLEALMEGLKRQDLYIPQKFRTSSKPEPDVIQAIPKYEVGQEPREIYFFREGTVVLWNIPELELGNVLQFLKNYEDNSYKNDLIHAEGEVMSYTYAEKGKRSHLKDGDIVLAPDTNEYDKYTFSNAVAQSVKLGIWEASLNLYVNSIEFVTEDLKAGRTIKMTREEVLRKQGELFALRHLINLSSDLLDTPDFYWERDDLETLYHQTCSNFNITKRTRVMNEKINHCVELVELLSSHLSDKHHVRLEWMIIILIMVEVGFEILHYIDRYFVKPVNE